MKDSTERAQVLAEEKFIAADRLGEDGIDRATLDLDRNHVDGQDDRDEKSGQRNDYPETQTLDERQFLARGRVAEMRTSARERAIRRP